jgi:hypothetical protein
MNQRFLLTLFAFLCLLSVTTPQLGCKNTDETAIVTVRSKSTNEFAGKYAQDWMC